MRVITKTVYTFDELSPEAQQQAIDKERSNVYEREFFWRDEAFAAINEGLQAFQCKLKSNYSIDWGNKHQSDLTISTPENAEELTGIRLRTWLLNNCDSGTLTAPKTYGKYEERANGEWRYDRYSKILKVDSCCPFTGVCYDESFLDPIRAFIKKPDNSTLQELMEQAAYNVIKDTESEIDYIQSDEGIREYLSGQDYEYDIHGIKTY